jgi:hypothetical protein
METERWLPVCLRHATRHAIKHAIRHATRHAIMTQVYTCVPRSTCFTSLEHRTLSHTHSLTQTEAGNLASIAHTSSLAVTLLEAGDVSHGTCRVWRAWEVGARDLSDTLLV